ncbi:MAG: hypothetical protein AB1632_04785 [Nitrospirota bacterium]
MVGGYLRDVLLGRKSIDRDFAAKGNLQDILEKIAAKTDGRIICIGKRNFYRIVSAKGLMLDFSPVDKDIEHDLRERDFTVNSMAWSPGTGIIDLNNGMNDLSKKIIKMNRIDNLLKDPVRILRAYRLADEMSFKIDPKTRNALKTIRKRIREAKSERITLEFFRILNSNNNIITLRTLLKDGILEQIIPLSHGKLEDKLKVIYNFNKIFDKLPLRYKVKLGKEFSQGLSYKGLLTLEILMLGSPYCDHLTMSSRINEHISLLRNIRKFTGKEKRAREELYRIFKTAGRALLDYILINNMLKYINEYERYVRIMKKCILPTKEIMQITGLKEGKALGTVIEELKRAEFICKIKHKGEAIDFIKEKCLFNLT